MSFRIVFNPEVAKDLSAAIQWYNEQQDGLGNKFLSNVKKQINTLKTSALHHAVRYDDVRCTQVKKFPYMVHYRVDIQNRVVKVEAIFNTFRNPERWAERSKEG